jgi:hypothetical protein
VIQPPGVKSGYHRLNDIPSGKIDQLKPVLLKPGKKPPGLPNLIQVRFKSDRLETDFITDGPVTISLIFSVVVDHFNRKSTDDGIQNFLLASRATTRQNFRIAQYPRMAV